MTKQELYNYIQENIVFDDNIHEQVLLNTLNEFFSQNVVIPKGTNRHPYADVLHQALEGAKFQQASKIDIDAWKDANINDIVYCDIYRIKPQEPVYEWQWEHIIHGIRLITNEFMTEEEVLRFIDTPFIKIESTKRIRERK